MEVLKSHMIKEGFKQIFLSQDQRVYNFNKEGCQNGESVGLPFSSVLLLIKR
jgi:hypothetical protein